MEPYLSRIGDITIERVAPRRLPQPPVSVQPPPVPEDPPPEEPQDDEEQEMRDDSFEAAEDQSMEVEKSPEPKDTGGEMEEEKPEGDEEKDGEEEQQLSSSSSEDDSQDETADQVQSATPEETKEGKEKDSESSSGPSKDSEMPQEARDGDSEAKTEGEGEGKTEGEGSKEESKKRKCDDGSSDDKSKKKKKKHKKESKKQDGTTEGDKESSSDSDGSDSQDKDQKKVERKSTNLRRNIREVMDESELDEETKAAQRQEMERLRRVQEQQRIIREVQRQIMMQNKQRGRPSISLQSSSSLLRQCTITTTGGSSGSSSSGAAAAGSSSSGVRIPSSVLMKLAAAGGDKKVIEMLTSGKTPQSRSSRSSSQESGGGVSILRTNQQGEELGSESDDEAELDDDDDIGVLSESEDIISISPRAREPLLRLGPEVSATPILPPEKPKELVTISSSSSEDEDCVILSPAASEEESEPEDPNNSGMHTNDLYNTPDDQGRVLINVGHPKEEPDIFLAPQIGRQIKPHQIGGLRFLYDNVVESLERFNTSPGFGCILAHSMGLGKTLQVVAFCEVFLKHTPARTVLCIMPINTLQNWLAEFNMWLPEKLTDAQLASGEAFALRNFPLLILNDSHKSLHARAKVIREWYRNGGVLLMGYELYRQLSLRRDKLRGRKKGRRSQFELPDIPDEGRNKQLWDDVHEALVKPGPDLVICDEGHRIKNSHASISHALKSLSTKRRVVLTGYPLQNNLLEYWCMVDFVRPNYLGTKTEFCNMFERPIQNGQCIDSTPQDIRLMRYRAHVLHSLLEGFVQRRSHSVLQVSLPQKEEYVLLLRMTAFQRALYNKFMNEVVRVKAVPNPLKAFAVCCKIWNHPDVLYYFLKKHEDVGDDDLDIEEAPNPAAAAIDCPPGSIAASVAAVAAGAGEIIPKPGKAVKGRPRLNAKKEKPSKPAASINPTHNPPKPEETETKPAETDTTTTTTTTTTEASSLPATNVPSTNVPATNASPTASSSQNPTPPSSGPPNYPNFPNYNYYDANSSYTDPQYNQQYPDFYNQQYGTQGQYYPEQYPNNPNYFPQQQGAQNYPYWQQGQYTGQDPNYQQNYQGNPQQSGFYGNSYPNAGNKPGETFPASSEFPQGNFNSYPNATPGQANPVASQSTNGQPSTSVTPATSEIPNASNLPSCQLQSTGVPATITPPPAENSVVSQPANPTPTPGTLPPDPMLQNHLANPTQPTLNGGESVPIQNGLEIPPIANESNIASEIPPISQPIAGSNSQSTPTLGQNGHTDVLNGAHVSPENSQSMTATADVEALDTAAFRQFSDTEVKAEVDKIAEAAEAAAELKTETSPKPEKQEAKEGGEEGEEKKVSSPVEGMKFPVRLEGGKSLLELGTNAYRAGRDEPSISYDWATELLRCYEPGHIESCAKMEIMFCILEQSILLGDRMLVFSQSLFTLNLIEDFLQRSKVPGTEERWARNLNYYRLDGSTSALEREKLINEYNSNPKIHLFLVSTRAGSLGINLVGANRVVVFDASWNPCHDTQAVCRVYRYGQRKPCFVYRLVMDHCLEKKIYDRQINKQGMADRVVDELNPDAHLSIKDVSNLLYDSEPDECESDFSGSKDKYIDVVLQKVLARHSYGLSKEPFQHESLLVDRKEKKLSQAERRLAKRNYELEKQATLQPRGYPNYSVGPSGVANVNPPNPNAPGLQIRPLRQDGAKPIASVRPMQAEQGPRGQMVPGTGGRSRWIPAEVWQRQGMSAQEMTLPLDVVIPTNSPDRASIVLKAGQRVMVLKSPKGIYMQLENGKIIAIRTALKMGESRKPEAGKPAVASGNSILAHQEKVEKDNSGMKFPPKVSSVFPLKSNSEITITPRSSTKPAATNSTATVPPSQKPFADVVPSSSQWRNEQRPHPNTKPTPGRPPAASNQHFSQPTRPFYHQQNRNSATVAPEVKDIPIFDVTSHEFSSGTTARSSTNYQPKSSQQQPPPSYQHFQQQQQPRQEDYTAPRSTSSNYQQPFDNKSSYVSSTVQSSTQHTMSESAPMHRHQQSRQQTQQQQQPMPPMSQHAASARQQQQQQHFPQANTSTPSHSLGMSTQVKPQEMAPLPALQHHLSNSLMHDKHKVSNNPPNPGRSKTGAKPGRPKKINRDSFEFSEESKSTKPFVSATKSAEKPAANDFGYQQGNEYFGSQQYSAGYYPPPPPSFPTDKKKEEEKKKEARSEVPTTTSPSATMYNTSGGGIVAASQPPYSATDSYTQGQYPGYPNSYRNSTSSTYPAYPPFNPQYPEANSSMYSAFHRPEPFATGSDISSFLSHPFMPSSTTHFPASSSQSTTSPYYPQNVYPPTPGYARSPYPATSVDPYSYPTGFNPFLVPSTPGYSIPSNNPAPSEGNNSQ